MVGDVPDEVLSYLEKLQDVQCCRGLSRVHRLHARSLPSRRTVLRWFQQRPQLRITPSFAIEPLGLVHVHALVPFPSNRWMHLRHGVDARWVTNDLVTPCLYVILVCPREHVRDFRAALQRAGATTLIVTGSGWQSLPSQPSARIEQLRAGDGGVSFLQRYPFTVPVIFEQWHQRHSLNDVWASIYARLGKNVRAYLPRQRIHRVNGKLHVQEALAHLETGGLFRQYVMAHHAWEHEVELVLIAAPAVIDEFLKAASTHVIVSTRYRGEHKDVLQVITTQEFLLSCWALDACVFVVNHTATAPLRDYYRFAYEDLFHPATGTWRYIAPFTEADQ